MDLLQQGDRPVDLRHEHPPGVPDLGKTLRHLDESGCRILVSIVLCHSYGKAVASARFPPGVTNANLDLDGLLIVLESYRRLTDCVVDGAERMQASTHALFVLSRIEQLDRGKLVLECTKHLAGAEAGPTAQMHGGAFVGDAALDPCGLDRLTRLVDGIAETELHLSLDATNQSVEIRSSDAGSLITFFGL